MEEDIQERGNDGCLGTLFLNKIPEEILEGNATMLTHILARLPYISCVKKADKSWDSGVFSNNWSVAKPSSAATAESYAALHWQTLKSQRSLHSSLRLPGRPQGGNVAAGQPSQTSCNWQEQTQICLTSDSTSDMVTPEQLNECTSPLWAPFPSCHRCLN